MSLVLNLRSRPSRKAGFPFDRTGLMFLALAGVASVVTAAISFAFG